jgi:membrane-bound lytic murein transglycosylase D
LGIATVIIVLMSGHETALPNEPRVDAGAPVASHAPSSAPPPTVAPPSPTTVEVHNLGQETPQLRALIDAQSRLASNCKNDSPQCRSPWTAFAREAMDPNQAPITLEPAPAAAPLSSWLVKLKKPADFPLVEHPLLKGAYDYDAKHIVGHAQFQQTYRRCSEYSDIIEGALLKYGAPTWLVAVVYQESQCDPLAKSPVGAAGLWQFMPESARAYDLRVVEDEVDERLNPIKATDAGVRFLTDLERKLGSWDLALAAYNVGPYGVAARLNRVGGKAGFWDLVRAGLLPDETARYVPAIEAHALVLNNMAALDFDRGGSPKDDAADVRVRSGTRLSLVARAANTSTLRIHDLNLDFLEEVVPNGETTVRVPGSEARGAQDFLDTVPPSDKRDLCVPKNFDWGKTDFDTSPYAKSCGQGGAVQ